MGGVGGGGSGVGSEESLRAQSHEVSLVILIIQTVANFYSSPVSR